MGVVAAGKFYVGILVFVVLCCGALTLMSCPQAPMVGVTGHSRFGWLITLDTVCELSNVHTKRKRKNCWLFVDIVCLLFNLFCLFTDCFFFRFCVVRIGPYLFSRLS